MKNFFRKKGVRVAIVLVAVLAVILVSALIMDSGANVADGSVRTLTGPAEKALTWVVRQLEHVYGYMFKYDRLVEENEELRAKILEMQDEVRKTESTNEENALLRQLLKLSEVRPELDFEMASITSWSASTWSSSFVINRGSRAGIELYDCVVTETGCLVGQVVAVTGTTATVRTLVDSSTSIGAYIGRTGISAVAEGDYDTMHEGVLKLSYLPDGALVYNGDTVLTSGSGEVFPPDIVIGEVTAMKVDEGGFTEYGIIEPAVQLSTLTHVFVIKDFTYTSDDSELPEGTELPEDGSEPGEEIPETSALPEEG